MAIPDKNYTVESGKILSMSYGMFTDIMRILGDDEPVPNLMSNTNIRDWVIRRLFTEAKKPVENVEDLINPYEIDINPLEQDGIVAWVADHVMHFTTSIAEKTRPVVEKYQERLEAVSSNLSKTGSEN